MILTVLGYLVVLIAVTVKLDVFKSWFLASDKRGFS